MQAADNAGGESTITVPAGEYRLTIPSTGADDPSTGDLDVRGSSTAIAILGAGAAGTDINANELDRAFAVQSAASLTISGVTVQNGAQPASGPSAKSSGRGEGGAFLNRGSLTIEASVLSGNSAANTGGAVVAEGEASETAIIDSTLEHNTTDGEGGVIYADHGSVTLSGDAIKHNSADLLGGALSYSGAGAGLAASPAGVIPLERESANTVTVSASTISDNAAGGSGGAIYASQAGPVSVSASTLSHDASGVNDGGAIFVEQSGPLTVGGSSFENDTAGAYYGGAIDAELNSISVSGSSFRGDQGSYGGALYLRGTASETPESITTSTFAEDSATGSEGGAIYDEEGDLQISASTLTDDSATGDGGGLYYGSGDELVLANDTFDGSQAGYAGGAIFLASGASTGEVVLLNDTISRNTAYHGGGIYQPESANTIENTIVSGNYGGVSAGGGGECYGTGLLDNAKGADRGGNIDGDGSCFSSSVTGDHTAASAMLGELAPNGGPTETDGLLPGSPALGDGVDAPRPCPVTDQRGVSRSGGCDSGAFQGALASPAAAESGTHIVTAGVERPRSTAPAPCRSKRSETIRWRLGAGVHLRRIIVTRGGRHYRTLAGSARKLKVSMVGLAKGPLRVQVSGFTRSGARYQLAVNFHLCIPGGVLRRRRSDYLVRR